MNEKNDYLVKWNYHAIFIMRNITKVGVYDQDSRLPWGVDFK